MEEYGIMEYLELIVTRCGQWMGNRELIWSGLNDRGIIEREIVDKLKAGLISNFGIYDFGF